MLHAAMDTTGTTGTTGTTPCETIPYRETRQGRLWHLSTGELARMRGVTVYPILHAVSPTSRTRRSKYVRVWVDEKS